MGFDIKLSKAIIFGSKSQGGLGLTSPVDLFIIESVASMYRFVNATSPITRNIARQAILKKKAYKDELALLHRMGWEWIKPSDPLSKQEWQISDPNNENFNLRLQLLEQIRSKRHVTGEGNLDWSLKWHDISLNFWKNPTLNYYQQRLCFANLHKSVRLSSFSKGTPNCSLCKEIATWEHVFFHCEKATFERNAAHKKWDLLNIGKIRIDILRIFDNKTLQFYPNGIVIYRNFKSWANKKKVKPEITNNIYRIFVTYIENCYKNSNWNTSMAKDRNYNPNPDFPTHWQSKSQIPQP